MGERPRRFSGSFKRFYPFRRTPSCDNKTVDEIVQDMKNIETVKSWQNILYPKIQAIPLSRLLKDSSYVASFLSYLQLNKAHLYTNCVLFCLEILQFQLLESNQLQHHSTQLITKYLITGQALSLEWLCTSDQVLALQSKETISKDIFDDILKMVLAEIETKCYFAFTHIEEYTTMMNVDSTAHTHTHHDHTHEEETLSNVLENASLATLFFIFLVTKRKHQQLALWIHLKRLGTLECTNRMRYCTYLYKTYITRDAPQYVLLKSQVQVEIETKYNALRKNKNKVILSELVDALFSIQPSLLYSLQCGFYQLFLDSELYKRYRTTDCINELIEKIVLPPGYSLVRTQTTLRTSTYLQDVMVYEGSIRQKRSGDVFALKLKKYYSSETTSSWTNVERHGKAVESYIAPHGVADLFDTQTMKQYPIAYNFICREQETIFYCACLITVQNVLLLPDDDNDNGREQVPRIICLRTTKPQLVSLRARLQYLFRSGIDNLTSDKMSQQLIDLVSTPIEPVLNKAAQLPGLPHFDASLERLFTCLEIDEIVEIFFHLLLEKKVVFISSYYTLLTEIAQGFLALLFPCTWKGLYIPLLPRKQVHLLTTSSSFLFGLPSTYAYGEDIPRFTSDICVVDLDRGAIVQGKQKNTTFYPLPRDRLTYQLNMTLFASIMESDSVDSFSSCLTTSRVYPSGEIRKLFMHFMEQLLHGYHRYCLSLEEWKGYIIWDGKGFVAFKNMELQDLVQEFMETTHFLYLIETHSCTTLFPSNTPTPTEHHWGE